MGTIWSVKSQNDSGFAFCPVCRIGMRISEMPLIEFQQMGEIRQMSEFVLEVFPIFQDAFRIPRIRSVVVSPVQIREGGIIQLEFISESPFLSFSRYPFGRSIRWSVAVGFSHQLYYFSSEISSRHQVLSLRVIFTGEYLVQTAHGSGLIK